MFFFLNILNLILRFVIGGGGGDNKGIFNGSKELKDEILSMTTTVSFNYFNKNNDDTLT